MSEPRTNRPFLITILRKITAAKDLRFCSPVCPYLNKPKAKATHDYAACDLFCQSCEISKFKTQYFRCEDCANAREQEEVD